MTAILLRAASFSFILIMGIFFRKIGLMPENAGDIVKKLMLNFTLPAAIIVNFANLENTIDPALSVLVVLGVLMDVIPMLFGAWVTRGSPKGRRATYMFCLPAYNLGTFCMPFVQSFYPGLGTVATCVFDAGNSIMCTGAEYAFVSEYLSETKHGFSIRSFFGRLIRSTSLDVYVIMLVLSLCGIKPPAVVAEFLTPVAQANVFIAMLMLGLIFHLELKREYLKEVARILLLRQMFAVVFASLLYFFMPFELLIRQILVLICFSPLSALSPAYTGMCDGDQGMAGCANSISIILSMVEISAFLMVWGVV